MPRVADAVILRSLGAMNSILMPVDLAGPRVYTAAGWFDEERDTRRSFATLLFRSLLPLGPNWRPLSIRP